MVITFEELRRVKDLLPHGSIHRLALEFDVEEQSVRNYFGSTDYSHGGFVDAHYERGVHGGYVKLEDTRLFDRAIEILEEHHIEYHLQYT